MLDIERKERVPRKREEPGGTRGDRTPTFVWPSLPLPKLVSRVPSPTPLLSIHTTPSPLLPRIGCINTCISVHVDVCVYLRVCALQVVLLQLVARLFWWKTRPDCRARERERAKEGVVCANGGWRRVAGERGGRVVRVGGARARDGVLAATRVVEREISRRREETKKREVTSPQGP